MSLFIQSFSQEERARLSKLKVFFFYLRSHDNSALDARAALTARGLKRCCGCK